MSKPKDLKIEGLGPLLGSSDVEQVLLHAIVAPRTYISMSYSHDYATLHYNYRHNYIKATAKPHYTALHNSALHYLQYIHYSTPRSTMLHYTALHSITLPYANYSYTHATANAATTATILHCTKLQGLRELHYTKLCSLHYTALKHRATTNTATSTTTLTLYYTIHHHTIKYAALH